MLLTQQVAVYLFTSHEKNSTDLKKKIKNLWVAIRFSLMLITFYNMESDLWERVCMEKNREAK